MTQEAQTEPKAKVKIFGFINSGSYGFYEALSLSEDGRVLAQHICTNEYFVEGDLTHSGRVAYYDELYGADGWEFIHVKMAEVQTHPGLIAAVEANAALPEEEDNDGSCESGCGSCSCGS